MCHSKVTIASSNACLACDGRIRTVSFGQRNNDGSSNRASTKEKEKAYYQ
ncbi:hypothetical protein G1C97_0670 [Bifidobacterium sp. DSM 109959]|uniref:Uncharacterized protein n=1 Tax=Bifidobacterium olomucense TaxID=2675324 RepID=A0A7Y0EYM1_9BIFI|nr:hypothetical protein [Bifidobacterium sp. DSM 109959]